ncbi:MAG: hypothetical protein LIP77_01720 [Planctomycetes bacterium]|nr:hypothetical protein [Planctomycetota bacterium]
MLKKVCGLSRPFVLVLLLAAVTGIGFGSAEASDRCSSCAQRHVQKVRRSCTSCFARRRVYSEPVRYRRAGSGSCRNCR